MPQEIDPKQIEESINNLVKKEFALLNDISRIEDKLNIIKREIDSLSVLYEIRTGKYPKKILPPLAMVVRGIKSNTKIGDAVFAFLLNANKPLTKDEIISHLRDANIRLSSKYPRNVLNTALKTDNQERFVILEDGKVSLTKDAKDALSYAISKLPRKEE